MSVHIKTMWMMIPTLILTPTVVSGKSDVCCLHCRIIMNDHIRFLVSLFRFQLELLGIILRDAIKYFFPTSPKSLKSEVILVTRGSNGIGRELLRRLALEENDLTLISWDVDGQANQDVVKELKDLGVKRVMAYNVDITNRDEVSKAAAEIRKSYGDVTMLFNNAGNPGPAETQRDNDTKDSLKTLDINLRSHIYTVQEFLPAMLRNDRGHIIGTCCILSFLEDVHGLPYCESKHGLGAFYEWLKADLRKSGWATNVHVTSVEPGFVSTDLVAPFNFCCKVFQGLLRPLSPNFLAKDIVKGARENKARICVLPFWRFFHTFVSVVPTPMNTAISDARHIDPLNPKVS